MLFSTFEERATASRRAVLSIRDVLCEALGGGRLEPNEGTVGPTAHMLDLQGVDLWLFYPGRTAAAVPVASRVQWDCNFRSWTIRYQRKGQDPALCEFGRYETAMRTRGAVWPHLMVHAYFEGAEGSVGKPRRAAICRTENAVRLMREHLNEWGDRWVGLKTNGEDGTLLGYVTWAEMVKAGHPAVIIESFEPNLFGSADIVQHNGGAAQLRG